MIHEVVSALVELALPRPCLGCGAVGGPLCGQCRPGGAVPVAAGLPMPVAAAGAYDDVLRTAVLAYKERGRRDLAGPLGAMLADAVSAALSVAPATSSSRVLLVPVPSSAAARAARGGDHVRRLARRAAPRCGLRIAAGALELTRVPCDSAGLGVEERAANLRGAMRAVAAPAGAVAVIIDDVVTTGATLREAHRALLASGWSVAAAATVAATARRHPPRPVPAGDFEPLAAHSGPD